MNYDSPEATWKQLNGLTGLSASRECNDKMLKPLREHPDVTSMQEVTLEDTHNTANNGGQINDDIDVSVTQHHMTGNAAD